MCSEASALVASLQQGPERDEQPRETRSQEPRERRGAAREARRREAAARERGRERERTPLAASRSYYILSLSIYINM
jgi:hypothetical protein